MVGGSDLRPVLHHEDDNRLMGEAKRRREQAAQTGVERTDVTINPARCPHCREKMSTLFTLDRRDDALPMDPTSVVICHHCTGVSIVNTKRRLVKFDEQIVKEMHPDDLASIALAVDHLRKLKASRGEIENPILLNDLIALSKKTTGQA